MRSKGEDEVVFVFVLFVLVVCRVGKKRLLDKPKRTHGRVVTGTKWCTKLSRQKDGQTLQRSHKILATRRGIKVVVMSRKDH